ncbi:LolA family protein [Thermoactinospora rubra]|uniref:LolA family protein n=1 Tax=Thermoactinospora rubra TaxID=1088767 RepID=UPI00117DBFE0|nr:DUF2092 domain-containing protein [Thermoactinospora rubra]
MRTGKLVRWGVPVAAVAVIGAAVAAGPVIAAVGADPVLPERTASRLLADAAAAARRSDGPPPMSGTVTKTASLGLPQLPGGPESPAALLSGAHEAKVWYGSHDRLRVALPGEMSEKNLIVNGEQAWLWDSSSNTATKIKMPAGEGQPVTPQPTDLTPQQAGERLLAEADRHSTVSVTNTDRVAGRPVYQLVLTPKDPATLVREVRLAVDGETYVPLRVQVYAKGSAEPAFELGFTEIAFEPPAEENFTFTPPQGVKVEEKDLGSLRPDERSHEGHKQEDPPVKTVGDGWGTIAVLPFDRASAAEGEGRQVLDSVLAGATPVSGSWGSGRIVKSKLLTALLTDDGRLLVGAVTPDRLIEAAGTR